MTIEEILWLATKAVAKKWDRDDLRYCDDLYGRETDVDEVWRYVEECEEIGRTAFKERYVDYELYHCI